MDRTDNSQTLETQLAQMAAILGLEEPISETVLRVAVSNDTYAHNLLICRENPDFLHHLLANPPALPPQKDTEHISSGTLVKRAAESLLRWAKTGFSTVPETTFQKRINACNSCPNLKVPPEEQKALYKIAGAAMHEKSICGKCGCVVKEKARRIDDACPDAHPEMPGINRWHEPMAQQN